jgi:acetyl esterase/lipase
MSTSSRRALFMKAAAAGLPAVGSGEVAHCAAESTTASTRAAEKRAHPFRALWQLVYVVEGIHRAMAGLAKSVKDRPCFFGERIQKTPLHRGRPMLFRGNWKSCNTGRTVIEIIQQTDDTPPVYYNDVRRKGCGLRHHVIGVRDFDAQTKSSLALSYETVCESGQAPDRAVYMDTKCDSPSFCRSHGSVGQDQTDVYGHVPGDDRLRWKSPDPVFRRALVGRTIMSTATRFIYIRAMIACCILISPAGSVLGEPAAKRADDLTWAVRIGEQYAPIQPNITYRTIGNYEAKLDVFEAAGDSGPKPTVIYFYGAGWLGFTKEVDPFTFLPFLQLGWNVVRVQYRPSSVALAPAAVEDGLCALRWVARNANEYHFDTQRIVMMGRGAGGLIALDTAMIPTGSSGWGAPCDIGDMDKADLHGLPARVKVAAVVSWNGVSEVADLIEGPDQKGYAVMWVGNQTGSAAMAKLVSSLTYVRAGVPPVVSVHGDKDPIEPYSQAVRLHDALTKVGVVNKLVTVAGGGHTRFGIEPTRDAWLQVFDFLDKVGLPTN